jgi:hypothetical protein
MAVTITKAKAAKATKQSVGFAEAQAISYVEKALSLKAKLEKLAALKAEVEAEEKDLLKYVDTQVAKVDEFELAAGDYVIKIGPKGRKAVAFDNEAIKAALGDDLFDQIAQFKIEDLNKYLTGDQCASVITYDNVNKRRVVIEKADK